MIVLTQIIRERIYLFKNILQRIIHSGQKDSFTSLRSSILSWEVFSGVIVFGLLYFFSLLQSGSWHFFGFSKIDALSHIRSSFWIHELIFQFLILLGYLFIGSFIGVVLQNAWLLIGDLYGPWRISKFSKKERIIVSSVGTLFVHGAFLTLGIISYPALYQESFYQRGSILKWGQIFLTDFFPLWLVHAYLGFICFIVFVAFFQVSRKLLIWFFRLSPPSRVAITVLGMGFIVFFVGVWAVVRLQSDPNRGPNILFLSVDSLRADVFSSNKNQSLIPSMMKIARHGQTYINCVSPIADSYGAFTTLLTGKKPLAHGIRHPFPSAFDISLGAEALPAQLRLAGYKTTVLTDATGDFFSRVEGEFDNVISADFEAKNLVQLKVLERHPHFLPYITNFWGRKLFPSLRNSLAGSDPFLLAKETKKQLRKLQLTNKFFLMVHFSALHEPYPLTSVMASRKIGRAYKGSSKYAMPYTFSKNPDFSEEDQNRIRDLYRSNLQAVDASIGRILKELEETGLSENTWIYLWSNHGEQLFEKSRGQGHGHHLRGQKVLSTPFVVLEPRFQSIPRWVNEYVRTEDVAPTLLSTLKKDIPSVMQGIPLQKRKYDRRSRWIYPIYGETGLWFSGDKDITYGGIGVNYPSLANLLEEDIKKPGRYRLRPKWEDSVLVGKHRMIQVGTERLIYVPTREGVKFEYYDFNNDPEGLKNLAETQYGKERIQKLKEIFYSHLGDEWGWRPQNNFWIPEAFLKD